MELDPVFLSRLQFAWLIGFHILMPALTVGLASFIALLEGLHFFTGREIYFRISMFWIKIFSVAFGIGVVSGIIMPFQFGTNWSRYSDATANVLAPLFAYEGLTAFFLEAAFLGVLLFGRKLVPAWAHFISALMVAFGTLLSSFWILAANSWMQTPAGYEIIDGRFFPTDWFAVIFNPSFPYRIAHTVVGFFITTGCVVIAVGAYLIRKHDGSAEGRTMLSITFWLLTILVPLQIFIGDQHGLNTLEHQPAKLAAIEAHWETGSSVPLILFAIPDDANANNNYTIQIPRLGSLILTHSLDGTVRGLRDFPADQRPPVALPFFAFRIMVGIGLLMMAMVAASWWLRWRGRLYDHALFLQACQLIAPLGFIAVLAGWTTTEVGRQPWIVYGLMRTADAVSPSLTGADVLLSLLAYMAVYLVVFPAGFWIMLHIIRKGPEDPAAGEGPIEAGRPSRPITVQLQPEGEEGLMDAVLSFVPVWAVILAAGIFLYVLLDGFDLGVGILYGFEPDLQSRNLVMNSIAPVWDGNETWLVLGGLALLAAFPLAFAIIIPALYFPVLLMLLGLVFRGVAFEFRFRDREHKSFWDHGFFAGSALAAFSQGVMLGAYIQGFKIEGREFVGTSFDFISLFSIMTGVSLIFGYTLLGAGWLILKTEGDIQQRARQRGVISLAGVLVCIGLVSIWTPFASSQIAERWFSWPNILLLSPVPLATAATAFFIWRSLTGTSQAGPFIGAVMLFALSYLGIAISLWPFIVPHTFTLWQAASSNSTQAFLLVGTLFLLPVILVYTGWSYWVFRGKVRADIGYHH